MSIDVWSCGGRCPHSRSTENYSCSIARHFARERFVAVGDVVPVSVPVEPDVLAGCGGFPVDVFDDLQCDSTATPDAIVCSDTSLFVILSTITHCLLSFHVWGLAALCALL